VALPRPVAAAEFSACGPGNAVGLTSILDRGQFVPQKSPHESAPTNGVSIGSTVSHCSSVTSVPNTQTSLRATCVEKSRIGAYIHWVWAMQPKSIHNKTKLHVLRLLVDSCN